MTLLAKAPARLPITCVHVVLQVIQGDVDEALRLMSMSKISLEDEELQEQVVKDPVREAFSKVRRDVVLAVLSVWHPNVGDLRMEAGDGSSCLEMRMWLVATRVHALRQS